MFKFMWTRTPKQELSIDCYESFLKGLKNIYKNKLLPLEKDYYFHYFHSPPHEDGYFDAKPMIMFLGQYSTGKTTLIKHLLSKDYPGIRIGPEPTTDKFISIMYGDLARVIPGHVLAIDPLEQFHGLSKFGSLFLNKFQGSKINCDVLKNLTVIDTPGILSGEKQRVNRGYDFVGVLRWFIERVDRIILLFDAHKLDISDEFRWCIEALQGHDDKISIILNKSDMVDQQQLMRVYGSLMWSLGKIINSPEVARVYIGSFWDQPLHFPVFKELFEAEHHDLLQDLKGLPNNSATRKLNDLIKRVRSAKIHACMIGILRMNMPRIFGKDKAKENLIKSLDGIFNQIKEAHNLTSGDFPDSSKVKLKLKTFDFSKLTHIDETILESFDGIIENDIKSLMESTGNYFTEERSISGGAFEFVKDEDSPFSHLKKGINVGLGDNDWIVDTHREKYNSIFDQLKSDEKVPGHIAKMEMSKSNLPGLTLSHIWKLSDFDNDGALDCDEFALAMYLIDLKMKGHDIPQNLPKHLIPPSKRLIAH